MGDGSAGAFSLAAAISLLGTPLLRRVAVATGFFDQPGDRKSHAAPVPYLGGIAIIVAALIALATGSGVRIEIGVLALGGAVLGLVGLLDDDRILRPGPRLFAQFGAALGAVVVGVRAEATGIVAFDIVLTVVWIVGITNALNLLDNMDGLAGGVAFVVSAAVWALAAAGGQDIVALFAAGTAGACLGFLAYNVRPASIYMGDAGSLFLGYVLSIAVLEVDPDLTKPASFVIPFILLALPVLDTATVTVARLRHGRRVGEGGKDHLSHRLVARGFSPGVAVGALVAAQAAMAVAGVLAGRDIIAVPAALGFAAVVLAAVAATTWRVPVYDEPTVRLPARVRVLLLGIVGASAVFVLVPLVALLLARGAMEHGADTAELALAAARAGDPEEATELFDAAARSFRTAHDRMAGPLATWGDAVPVLAPNLRAGRSLSEIGERLAVAGRELAEETDPGRLQVAGGGVQLDEIRRLQPQFALAEERLRDAHSRIEGIDEPYLLPLVGNALDSLDVRLTSAVEDASRLTSAAELTPAIFGGEDTRRYFLAVQNNAELRATGGFIGNFGELVAENGKVRLESFQHISALNDAGGERTIDIPADFRRYERFEPTTTWQNVNMSPDFPTVAGVIDQLYPQSGGRPIDGVLAVDPPGLAALLAVTGEVTVPAWPEPITAENVVDVSLRQAYEAFPTKPDRIDFLGDVARAVFDVLTTDDLGQPATIAGALGDASRGGHLMLWLEDPEEQALVEQFGASGAVEPVRSDALMVVSQNAAGNKTDFYLERELSYDVELRPDGDRASVRGEVTVELANGAPAAGLNREVIGPYDERFAPGQSRSYLSVYTPHDFTSAALGDRPVGLESQHELGRKVFSRFVDVPSGGEERLTISLEGEVRLGEGGWYALDLSHQPVLHHDRVRLALRVPDGWRIAAVVGLDRTDARRASVELEQRADLTVWARLERDDQPGFWDRLRGANVDKVNS